MARTQTATCQDCGWQGPVEDALEFRHLHERVLPGDVMPVVKRAMLTPMSHKKTTS